MLVVIVAVTVWQPWSDDPAVLRHDGTSQSGPAPVIMGTPDIMLKGLVNISWQRPQDDPVAGDGP